MQIQAPLELSLFLKHYLFLELNSNVSKKYRLFSNGNPALVFVLNENSNDSKIDGVVIPEIFVFGQITTSIDIQLSGNTKILAIIFQPNGLHRLTNLSANRIKDAIVDAEHVFGKEIKTIRDAVIGIGSKDLIVKRLNKYFQSLIVDPLPKSSTITTHITDKIIRNRGIISIQNIKDEFLLHERKLQRLFANQIGISPKKFIQIVKLHSFIGHLHTNLISKKITSSVFEAGYYDQSHLIKEFKNITRMTPMEYIRARAIAVNLIEVA